MTYYGPKEIADSFRTVRKNTIAIANEIGEEHYGFRATPETRTIGQMLFHLAWSPSITLQVHAIEKRLTLEGFDFMGVFGKLIADEQAPQSKQEIIDALTSEGARFARMARWHDGRIPRRAHRPSAGDDACEQIAIRDDVGVKEHEMHHRAQLMLMERMLGIVPQHDARDAGSHGRHASK